MQINLWLVIGIIAFGLALSGVILANMFVIMMIGEINRKREDGKLISYFGFTPPKTMRIFDDELEFLLCQQLYDLWVPDGQRKTRAGNKLGYHSNAFYSVS